MPDLPVGYDARGATRGAAEFAQASSRITSAARAATNGVDRIGQSLGSVARFARNVAAPLAALGGGFGALKLAERAGEVEGLRNSFSNLFRSLGQDPERVLAALQRGTRGTVDELSLLRTANNAVILGVAKTAEEFEQLATLSRRLGQAVGRSAVEAFNDLAVGIGRQSRLVLDNLGIVVDADRAYAAFAARVRKTADDLTDAERKQAFLNATLAAAGDVVGRLGADVDTLSGRYGRFRATFSDLTTAIAEATGPALIAGLERFARFIRDNQGNIVAFFEILAAIAEKTGGVISSTLEFTGLDLEGQLSRARRAQGELLRAIVVPRQDTLDRQGFTFQERERLKRQVLNIARTGITPEDLDLSNVLAGATTENIDRLGEIVRKIDRLQAAFDKVKTERAREELKRLQQSIVGVFGVVGDIEPFRVAERAIERFATFAREQFEEVKRAAEIRGTVSGFFAQVGRGAQQIGGLVSEARIEEITQGPINRGLQAVGGALRQAVPREIATDIRRVNAELEILQSFDAPESEIQIATAAFRQQAVQAGLLGRSLEEVTENYARLLRETRETVAIRDATMELDRMGRELDILANFRGPEREVRLAVDAFEAQAIAAGIAADKVRELSGEFEGLFRSQRRVAIATEEEDRVAIGNERARLQMQRDRQRGFTGPLSFFGSIETPAQQPGVNLAFGPGREFDLSFRPEGLLGTFEDQVQFSVERIDRASDRLGESVGDFARSILDGEESFRDSVRGLADGIRQAFVEEFVIEPIVDLTRNLAKSIVLSLIQGIGAGAGGAAGGAGTPVATSQLGNVFTSPAITRIAETGQPEAVLPLVRGPGGRLGVGGVGGANGDTYNVSVNLNGVTDMNSFRRSRRQVAQAIRRGITQRGT